MAPGQGAQLPGMLTPWLTDGAGDARAARERLDWFAAVTDVDLTELGTRASAAAIRDTSLAQPLLVAAGLLAAAALADTLATPGLAADVLAGHSVGELTVAALSGSLTSEQALVLVVRRGRAMAAAAAATTGAMTAVLGGDPEEVLAALARHGLVAANVNGGGQVVAAGDPEALAAFTADPPAGARLRPLAVAGAFHTDHMAPAALSLRHLARGVRPAAAVVPVVSNRDGVVVTDGTDLLGRIVDQVAGPVRWDACQQTLAGLGVTGLLELAPAGTLTGLARRGLPGVDTFALRTPDDLDDAATFVRAHTAGAAVPVPTTTPGSGAGGTPVEPVVLHSAALPDVGAPG